ncbi:MAG: hypothetical protein ACQ9ET_01690 [Nitrosomonadaceae bacterium]
MSNTDTPTLDDEHKECQFCAEVIKKNAILCRYCESSLPPVNPPADEKKSNRTIAANKKVRRKTVTKKVTKKKPLSRRTACEICGKSVYRVSLKNGICRNCRPSITPQINKQQTDSQRKIKSGDKVKKERVGKVGTNKKNIIDERIANEILKLREKCPNTAAQSKIKKFHIRARDARETAFYLPAIIGFVFIAFILFSIFSDDDEPTSAKTYSPSNGHTKYGSTYQSKREPYIPHANTSPYDAERLEASRLADRLRQKGYTINRDEELPLYRGAKMLNKK